MLELNIGKSRSLNFEIEVSGIDPTQLEGFVRIIIDGVEYGFKGKVGSESIEVEIPALKTLLKRTINEGEKFDGKLEVHGNGFYLNPWNGSFIVKNPVVMEAKIKEDIDDNAPKIVAKVKSEPSVDKAKDKLNEMKKIISKPPINKSKSSLLEKKVLNKQSPVILTEKHVIDYMASKGTTNKQIQEVILEQCRGRSRSDKPEDLLRAVVKFYKNKS